MLTIYASRKYGNTSMLESVDTSKRKQGECQSHKRIHTRLQIWFNGKGSDIRSLYVRNDKWLVWLSGEETKNEKGLPRKCELIIIVPSL